MQPTDVDADIIRSGITAVSPTLYTLFNLRMRNSYAGNGDFAEAALRGRELIE